MINNTIKYYKNLTTLAYKNLLQGKKFQFRKYMMNNSLNAANSDYFLKLHRSEKAFELIKQYTKDMQNMHIEATKQYNIVLQQIKSTDDKVLQQKILSSYAEMGITGFIATNGAKWNIETYSAMYTRHVNNTLLRMEVLESTKSGKVKISTHGTICNLCKPYEGQILTIEEVEEAEILGLFHPNCLHFCTEVNINE